MRIISGSKKGRKLKYPKLANNKKVRPLSNSAKEGLFNILAPKIEDSYFLDLFAGSGQVGIEALSRGAELAIFVEAEKKAAAIIRENLISLDLMDRAEIFILDAERALSILGKKKAKFDIIFIGAPYHTSLLSQVLGKISGSDIIKENGIVIAEFHKKQKIDNRYGIIEQFREERYGDTVFSFFLNNVREA